MFSSIKELEDRNRERQILKEEMTKAIHANSKIESNKGKNIKFKLAHVKEDELFYLEACHFFLFLIYNLSQSIF